MKDDFQKAAGRDKKAAAYFSSTGFLDVMRHAVEEALVNSGGDRACIHSVIYPQPQDMPYIQKAFLKLKEEYPELDHVRLNSGFASRLGGASVIVGTGPDGCIVVDTKKDTFLRRVSDGRMHAW